MQEGSFREDLYYRINVLSLTIPPLRERGEDVKFLARNLMLKKCRENHRYLFISERAMDLLLTYDWPGNVRQLEGFLERLLVLTEDEEVSEEMVRELLNEMRSRRGESRQENHAQESAPLLQLGSLEDIQREAIRQAYGRYSGKIEVMAQVLGISRTTLWRRLKEYQILPQCDSK